MKIKILEDESYIAATAARVLREHFIKVSLTETVLYVINDAVWSKSPNGDLILNNCLDVTLSLPKNFLVEALIKLKNETLAPQINS